MTEEKFLNALDTSGNEKVFEDIKRRNLPVIIFGAAACAKKVTEELATHDITVSAYAIDADYYKPHQTYLGKPIYNFAELERDKYVFVLGIGDKNDKDGTRINQLLRDKNFSDYEWALGYCCRISYDFISQNIGEFVATYNLLADDFSEKTMLNYLKTHITRNFSYLRDDVFTPCEYFNEIIRDKLAGGGGCIC